VQASASGVIAAREILRRIGAPIAASAKLDSLP